MHYCGKAGLPKGKYCTGTCGPTDGLNCAECALLDKKAGIKNFYAKASKAEESESSSSSSDEESESSSSSSYKGSYSVSTSASALIPLLPPYFTSISLSLFASLRGVFRITGRAFVAREHLINKDFEISNAT
ncbi:hypothetical protein Pelo_3389 [Pelomyxa schiedti]|nr:hypothetical protein Pelo_3389 [Pelomyxa schiedti]